MEAEAGDRIVTVTGGLDLWPADPAIPTDDYIDSLMAEGVPFERLDAAEVMRRWPQWHLADDVTALWQAQGGLADPFRGNAAHRRLAVERGATLRDRTPVTAIRQVGDAYEVDADDTTYTAGRVVITADAWTNELLAPFDRRLPLTVTKEQVTYFANPDPAAFAPDRFPVWIWMDDPSFYGFPTYGEAGPKVAQDCGGEVTTAETRTFDRDEAAFARVTDFLATHLPGALGPPIYTKTCLYHADPGPRLRRRSPARRAGRGRRARRRPRVQVRLGPRPRRWWSSPSTARRRRTASWARFAIDRPILLETAPPKRPGWSESRRVVSRHRGAVSRARSLQAFPACATVPRIRAGGPLSGGDSTDAIIPARPDGATARGERPHGGAAAPSRAARPPRPIDDNILRVGTTQAMDSINPYPGRPSSTATRPSSSPTTCSSASGRTWSPSRASRNPGNAPPTASPGRSRSGRT